MKGWMVEGGWEGGWFREEGRREREIETEFDADEGRKMVRGGPRLG